jgi:hypothetical protein
MKRVSDQSLTKLADAAFEQAAKKVVERAIASGTPVIIWENDSVTKVKPQKKQTKRPKKTE